MVDPYGAITDRRVYKDARSHEEAESELRKNAGAQFAPHVVELFIAKPVKWGRFHNSSFKLARHFVVEDA
jgi:response regulator RpfG family c-di-GMP phosphodiesterase